MLKVVQVLSAAAAVVHSRGIQTLFNLGLEYQQLRS